MMEIFQRKAVFFYRLELRRNIIAVFKVIAIYGDVIGRKMICRTESSFKWHYCHEKTQIYQINNEETNYKIPMLLKIPKQKKTLCYF